ncbi:putative Histone-binding protein RBBP7 [Paratrimastix pyriformis]|uniref:Histone-binding protein RBBP7 n=1 Tax=Paratrimastix pyriformis TaxID=342808 RepID=A0ABQ8U756_9EUKA|nr:putative Histone-binding protein RBBP7 [Paratrimastix pyriformis]
MHDEYRAWKKNTPYLYDLLMMHALEWPSLTVQWLPEREIQNKLYATQKLILGTHTSDSEPNYLFLAEVRVPLSSAMNLEGGLTGDDVEGFKSITGKIEVIQKINHDGEVHRARYMPQNTSMIATKTVNADVNVFNYQNHPTRSTSRGCKPDVVLKGHSKEGWGLSWNPITAGRLLSSADDGMVCLWDVDAWIRQPTPNASLQPLMRWSDPHTSIVEDVGWSSVDPNTFVSVGDDRRLIVWDARQQTPATVRDEAHPAEINCVAFNPQNPHLLGTGSSDKTAALWDIRNLHDRLHILATHTNDVFNISWAPFSPTVLATAAADHRMAVWDISKIGAEQRVEDVPDGPPELLFIHGGHTSKISDFSWNPSDPWRIASVAEDNIIQIWEMAEAIHVDPLAFPPGDLE